MLEESCGDDLGPQELDALGREALLEESAPHCDQPPVGVYPPPGSSAWSSLSSQYWMTSSPLSGSLAVAPTGGRPMKLL